MNAPPPGSQPGQLGQPAPAGDVAPPSHSENGDESFDSGPDTDEPGPDPDTDTDPQ